MLVDFLEMINTNYPNLFMAAVRENTRDLRAHLRDLDDHRTTTDFADSICYC